MKRASKHLPIDASIDRISAEMGQHFWYVDASKAKNDLGWDARDPIETLSETVADLEKRGVVWPRA